MKMIDVLNMMAKNEIEEGTKLKHGYKIYDYINDYTESDDCSFVNKENDGTNLLEDDELITKSFLNTEVKLIPPKPKKYLVKFNMRGLRSDIDEFCYLNYVKAYEYVDVDDKKQTVSHKTRFTEQELQSIQPVREFLEDMKDKYELIEVEDNEVD